MRSTTHRRAAKVHPDHHVACQYALYSVPSTLCPPWQQVEVGLEVKLVGIFHKGQLVKVNPHQPRVGRFTDNADYPAELSAYTLRAPDGIRAKGRTGSRGGRIRRATLLWPPALVPNQAGRQAHLPGPAPSDNRVTELMPLLKRLQLGPMAATLSQRIALARREQLDYASFLQIILSDEVNRRAHRRLGLRVRNTGFQVTCRLEDFDWSAAITLDRRLLDAVFSLEFLAKDEQVLLVVPTGDGKTFLAQARVDNSVERTFRSFLSPDLLILSLPGSLDPG